MNTITQTPITYERLKSRGWRMVNDWPDPSVHMVYLYDLSHDNSLEVAPLKSGTDGHQRWFCWARSDMACRHGKFVFLREVGIMEHLQMLLWALAEQEFPVVDFDREEFAAALAETLQENTRAYMERGRRLAPGAVVSVRDKSDERLVLERLVARVRGVVPPRMENATLHLHCDGSGHLSSGGVELGQFYNVDELLHWLRFFDGPDRPASP